MLYISVKIAFAV